MSSEESPSSSLSAATAATPTPKSRRGEDGMKRQSSVTWSSSLLQHDTSSEPSLGSIATSGPRTSATQSSTSNDSSGHQQSSFSSIDAIAFHRKVEEAAKSIQFSFRRKRPKTRNAAEVAAAEDALRARENEAENTTAGNQTSSEEEEDDEEKDRSSLYTAIFIAIFGFGYFLLKTITGCFSKISKGDDPGVGDAVVAVDGGPTTVQMGGGTGGGGGGGGGGAPAQPPP